MEIQAPTWCNHDIRVVSLTGESHLLEHLATYSYLFIYLSVYL